MLSCLGAIRAVKHSKEMVREGYIKVGSQEPDTYYSDIACSWNFGQYRGKPFKLAMRHHWQVVVSDPKLVDEIRRAPDSQLSADDAANEAGLYFNLSSCSGFTALTFGRDCSSFN